MTPEQLQKLDHKMAKMMGWHKVRRINADVDYCSDNGGVRANALTWHPSTNLLQARNCLVCWIEQEPLKHNAVSYEDANYVEVELFSNEFPLVAAHHKNLGTAICLAIEKVIDGK